MANSNWIEIQGQMINFDNISAYFVRSNHLIILNTFLCDISYHTQFDNKFIIEFKTEQEAQAEHNRIKTILGVK